MKLAVRTLMCLAVLTLGVGVAVAAPGTTERVSVSSAGGEASGSADAAAISADGRFVAFGFFGSGLIPNDTNDAFGVFVKDRPTGAVERVSVDSAGAQANAGSSGGTISGDGTVAGFTSLATNLLPDDTNSSGDAFVHDNTRPRSTSPSGSPTPPTRRGSAGRCGTPSPCATTARRRCRQ